MVETIGVVFEIEGIEGEDKIKDAFKKGVDAASDVQIESDRERTGAEKSAELLERSWEHRTNADKASELASKAKGVTDTIKGVYDKNDPESDEKGRKTRTALQVMSSGVSGILTLFKGFSGASLNLINGIYDRMKSASPLLQAIESLFQLAMTLFFMPLGNKIAEVMLPAVLKLLDGVIAMWDLFDGKPLGEIFSIALTQGIALLGSFFKEIGSELRDQEGILGSIGTALVAIGDFITDSGEHVIETLFNIAGWVVEHMKEIVSAIVTLTGIHYSLMLAQISATIGSSLGPLGAILGGASVLGLMGSAVAGVGTYNALNGGSLFMAEGGYVPPTEGGTPHILGEGGVGEYVIPEPKLDSLVGKVLSSKKDIDDEPKIDRLIGKILDSRQDRDKEPVMDNIIGKILDSRQDVMAVKAEPAEKIGNIVNNREDSTVINNSFYIEGVTSEELGRMIDEKVNEQISLSRIRSGF